MHPFQFPTSTLVLDDDPLFLESFAFQFGDDFSCCTFTRPDAALAHLEAQQRTPLFRSSVALGEDARHQSHVSVVIVDYDMPKMTGVEFCRKIRGLPVKTLLLTGKAGLETAVSAFNERLIDCFLQKQDPQISSAVRREVSRLQSDYFERLAQTAQTPIAKAAFGFMDDPAVSDFFERLCREHEIVSHYVSAVPSGIVMHDGEWQTSILLLATTESLAAEALVAQQADAPDELIRGLSDGSLMTWFPESGGRFSYAYQNVWQHFAWPVHQVPGSNNWRYSLIRPSHAEELGYKALHAAIRSKLA